MNSPPAGVPRPAAPTPPPAPVLAAFGADGPPTLLPGGQGGSWRAGSLVLKPVAAGDEPTQHWLYEVARPAVTDPGVRLAFPASTQDGAVAVDGWAATAWLAGERPVKRWAERIEAARACARALAPIDPRQMPRREDPWARADRAAWGEGDQPLGDHPLAHAVGSGEPRPVHEVQVVHGDLAGNTLLHPGRPPAVIDLSLYVRPAEWAVAVLAVDMVAFEGAPVHRLSSISADPNFAHLLARALLFRMTTDIFLGGSPHPAYEPVAEAVLDISGDRPRRRTQVRNLAAAGPGRGGSQTRRSPGGSSTSVPEQMTAVRILGHGGLEALDVAQVPVPVPRAGEVLVKVGAVALNNTDLWTRQGAYGAPGDPDALAGWRGPIDFPRIQGADVAGVIAAVGPLGDSRLVGRRVVIDPAIYDTQGPDANPIGLMGSEWDGGYAEYVIAPVHHTHDVTGSSLSDAQLAALPTAYGTALGMIERGGVREGDIVLVTGASGGVGLALVQLASARGAWVLAVSSTSKLEPVRQAGADEVIDRAQSVLEQVRAASGGGVDVVLDVVAGDLMGEGLSLLREGGRWVVAGALGGHGVAFDVRRLYLHNAQIIGSSMHTPAHFALLMDIARHAQVRPVIAETYPLDQASQAQEELGRRRHVGKIVLQPQDQFSSDHG